MAQLRYWSRSGLVTPGSVHGGDGFRVALDAVRDAGHDLSSLRLITDGRHVWACHDDGQILDALRAGQLALFVAVDQVAADVDADVRAFSLERAAFVERLTAEG